MLRRHRAVFRAAFLSLLAVPCLARADALPSDPDNIYFHCTPAEQCPEGSETCGSIRGPAGQQNPAAICAEAAAEKKLEHRCWGRAGHLYCPAGAKGSWKAKTPPEAPAPAPSTRRGCR